MDSDGYSDLTDLESDEYEESSKKKPGKKNAAKGGGYRIRNALKVPRATTYTAQALFDQMWNCDINVDPEYQRDVVWPEAKQIGIIDSIFRNFYIPPVIFCVKSFDDGTESKTCIDGKQRLTSIRRFMDGEIPHKDPLTNDKLWYKEPDKEKRGAKNPKLLPEKYRRLFANKQIVCVEYQDISDSDEREIFQRVQLGMALTPAEKLQVVNTDRATFIRELLSAHLKDEGSLAGEAIEWDRSRGNDFRCIAQAVYCMDKWGEGLKTQGTIVQLEKWLNAAQPLSPTLRSNVEDTFRVFSDLVEDPKLNKVFKSPAKVSPVEFISIGLLLFAKKDSMSLAQLSAAIGQMRSHVRREHVDIRANGRVQKTMLDFIALVKPARIAGDSGKVAGSALGQRLKRKRESDEEGELVVAKAKKEPPTAAVPKPPPLTLKLKPTPKQPNPPTPVAHDRMAALRAAKNATAASSSQPLLPPPPPPPTNGNHSSQGQQPPQMLPSPGRSFSFSNSSFIHHQQQQQQHHPHPLDPHATRPADPRPPPSSAPSTYSNTHMTNGSAEYGGRPPSSSSSSNMNNDRYADSPRGPPPPPPPPHSASSMGGGGASRGREYGQEVYARHHDPRERDYNNTWDRDWERERYAAPPPHPPVSGRRGDGGWGPRR
ncbi:hypothetical protein BDQ12DRAFT_737722 [Crucibulum laeve]|uniref:GmrSD restriction endonucleases N-terminal domain-containing protein n=1 Tax=Crucibulum laeve TaxID=68775 RepID=A0A5C3LPR4_9AGAR|nr:hypothetical protein BDQ12DRAFT_737722 [Crucibulum laeve]